jgi:hypothetical protein
MTDVRPATATKREVYFSIPQLTVVNLGPGRERDVIAGSRQGVLNYYRNGARQGLDLAPRQLAAGEDGNALRNPCINAGVVSYAPRPGGPSDLIAGGEGALSYYAFTGRFTAAGRPIFRDPVPVRQENAELYAGTLPVPSVVDWDGDGVQDIVAGNSEGRVLFLRNVGRDAAPAFLPGVALLAGGRELHVEAGYSGSVQGVQESRWGYLSPNAIDWNGDGLPDLVLGDITGNFTLCLNRGAKGRPELEAPRPLYCDGVPLRTDGRTNRAGHRRRRGPVSPVLAHRRHQRRGRRPPHARQRCADHRERRAGWADRAVQAGPVRLGS